MNGVTELGYLRLGVSDLDAWREYAMHLGLEIADDSTENRLYLRMDLWHHRIVIVRDSADDMLAAGLRVAGPEEFAAMQQTLRDHGVAFDVVSQEEAADRHVLECLTLTDPSGVPVEIFHGPRVDTHRPFHPARRRYGRFVTGPGGLGHLMLKSDDFAQSGAFATMLGMRGGVEYRIPGPDGGFMDLWFYHCNERDHTFSYGFPTPRFAQHVMLEVDSLDDVYHTYEQVKDRYPIAIKPGKHANDGVFSFYCVSPSGVQVEIGYGGDDAKHQSEYYVGDTYGHEFVPHEVREDAA